MREESAMGPPTFPTAALLILSPSYPPNPQDTEPLFDHFTSQALGS